MDPRSDEARETMEAREPALLEQLAGRRSHDAQERYEAAQEARIAARDRRDDRAAAADRWWLS